MTIKEMGENVSHSDTQVDGEELSIYELIGIVWSGKWIIGAFTGLMLAVSVYYALSLPNLYQSESLLAPSEQDQSMGLNALQGQLGGLASLAGVNLGSGGGNTQLAIQILTSRQFSRAFIDKYKILPDLMAVKNWKPVDNTLVYDEDIYDYESNTWVREPRPPKLPKPSYQEAHKEFKKLIKVSSDSDTGLINLVVEHKSPYIAKDWNEWLIAEINQTMKLRDVEEAEKSQEYLKSQLVETNISDMREVLFRLIEEQAKIKMFASVRDEYVFKTIDPPLVSEEKSGPKRLSIVIFGGILGFLISITCVIIIHFARSGR